MSVGTGAGPEIVRLVLVAAAALCLAAAAFFWSKGRKIAGDHVFRASRLSRGNRWFPTQVAVTRTSVVHYTPELVGGREHSMHISHIASVLIDRNLMFSDVLIESSGGTSPVRCHGHRKADAVEMKRLIEQFQSEYYRAGTTSRRAPPPWSKKARRDVENLSVPGRRAEPTDIATRFQALVQSPLRAALLRFLCARPEEAFDVEALMQTFGRMRLDVENCVRELVAFGVVQRVAGGGTPRYAFVQPQQEAVRDLLDQFLERRATVSHEDRSPSVQSFREMIGRDEKMLVVFERPEATEGMYLSTESPAHSIRAHAMDGRTWLLVGGESHKTGQADARERYDRLERWTRERFGIDPVMRWATQDQMPADGVPYIGPVDPVSRNVFVATGFRKWGLAMGLAAAELLRAWADGRDHPWRDLFDTSRVRLRASATTLAKENANVALRFFGDRLVKRAGVDSIEPGEGRIVGAGLGQRAVYRDEAGRAAQRCRRAARTSVAS